MASFLRKLVSQNKNRLQEGGYDLDLTYLTDQIICMGLPAVGPEALYRNPIDRVVRFLEEKHSGQYKVFNLCNERTYDISKFGDACASFPFDDHGAPPLMLVVAFCRSAKSWLLQSLENVVAVHCKAGKGRTGLMACCLVMHLGYQRTATDAIAFYNGRRTKDGRGLTVPSQRRYVHYYERVLAGASFEGVQRTLSSIRVCGVPDTPRFTRLLITIRQHGGTKDHAPVLVVLEIDPRLPLGAPHIARCRLPAATDLCISVADESNHELFKMWVHPAMEADEATFVLDHDKFKSDLDVSDKGLPDGFTMSLLFEQQQPAVEALPLPPPPLPTALTAQLSTSAGTQHSSPSEDAASAHSPDLVSEGARTAALTPPHSAVSPKGTLYEDNYTPSAHEAAAHPAAVLHPAPSAREQAIDSQSSSVVKSVRM
mmetsp:Transcript_51278/g.133176  ORF Transcript_51278/g.133176 Transcript_51278/m.133176 type:complete len:427 (-) Transcript_51278:91-1371(-)